MKNSLLILIAITLCSMTTLEGQYFGEVGTKWSYKAVRGSNPDRLIIVEATGIEKVLGKDCTVLEKSNFACDASGGDLNYVYYEDGKVYWYNATINDFTLLYNFDAEVGDSWDVAIRDCTISILIDSVDYETIDGEQLKVLYPAEPITGFEDSRIIERLGLVHFLFPSFNAIPNCGGLCEGYRLEGGLRCYEDNQLIYQSDVAEEYCFLLNSTKELEENYEVLVVPTITSSEFEVQLKGESLAKITEVTIIDSKGTVFQNHHHLNQRTINLNMTSNGLYFILIKLDDGKVITRKVLVNKN